MTAGDQIVVVVLLSAINVIFIVSLGMLIHHYVKRS